MFKRLELVADEVEKIVKDEVLAFYDEFVKKGAASRKKLGVQVFAKQHMEKFEEVVADGEILIGSAPEFKRITPLFGLPPAVDLVAFKLQQP
jgi:hypothetical protein